MREEAQEVSLHDKGIQCSSDGDSHRCCTHSVNQAPLQTKLSNAQLCPHMSEPPQLLPQPLSPPAVVDKQHRDSSLNKEIPTNLSLSPLRFSDTSAASGANLIQAVLQMVDDDQSHHESTPRGNIATTTQSNNKENQPPSMLVKGSRLAQKSRVTKDKYVVPAPPKARRPKVRNYNIKND